MKKMLSYNDKGTWIHSLCGVTKLVYFLLWTITAMICYDIRVLAVMVVVSILAFIVSKTSFDEVKGVFVFILVFLTINLLAIFLFAPEHGSELYGTKHVLLTLTNKYVVTKEQLFYEANVFIKYIVIVPAVFTFMTTTNPSEFAASLNRVGIGYKGGYSLALALRYIPDVQADFTKIRNSQAARGIEMSKKASIMDRIKHTAAIIFPLIFTSMDRIDVVSNAMELRCFGKHKKRTWYMGRPLKPLDITVMVLTVAAMCIALFITFSNGSRFYNPFI
ncbi:MAG: energy-coupling factor transporter transmembrane component T [Lachnospiraceae bacterium]|nr:energy-coupling factor transporter transmembrane component T [Lachnospiraceae bacterium]